MTGPEHDGQNAGQEIQEVEDLYRQLSQGQISQTAWMGNDRETLLWLLSQGEPIPRNHPETIAAQFNSSRIEHEAAPHYWQLDRVVLLVIAALAAADLALILWFAHVILGWF
ncbi:hypothetical protein [Kineococcus sp. R86509]|uniref:hypothetical protein n=1 Tax=Kineococcus sp. R86509 TaxID=3093851 RepID=UPI0036D2659A